MPIISQTTWDKLIPENEKKALKEYYADIAEGEIFEEGKVSAFEHIFGKEALQPQLTYEDVAKELFENKIAYYINEDGNAVRHSWNQQNHNAGFMCPNNCTSHKQTEKLLAINKLLNVAKFLNKDWKPDWDKQVKWFIYIDYQEDEKGKVKVDWKKHSHSEIVYFRTEELAKQAIQILGEDTVRLALSSDY